MHSSNHGKPVYQKSAQVDGLDVMLYFWDERDGANFCGWWFGPKVGGDQVWAYHPDRASASPPTSGWKILYNGPVDQTLTITPRWGAGAAGAAAAPPVPAPLATGACGASASSWSDSPEARRRQLEAARQQEIQKQQQTLKLKQDLERKKLQEQLKQKAALKIRDVIQKVRSATPETFDLFKRELDIMLAAELDNCGDQRQMLIMETEKAFEQGRSKVEGENRWKQESLEKQLRQQREVEERKKLVEDNKKKIEENKKKLEEDLKKQKQDAIEKRAEEVRRAREDTQRKAEEEKKRKVDAEERKLQEHQAVMAIRRVLQKVRVVRPEVLDEVKQELETVLALELENAGSQRDVIKQESDKMLEQTMLRITKIQEQRQRQQEKKGAVMKLVRELEDLVAAAESAVVKLKESAAFFDDSTELSVTDVEEISQVIGEGAVETSIRTKACTDFLAQYGKDMKDPVPLEKDQPLEVKEGVERLVGRINICSSACQATFTQAQEAKDKAMRHACAFDRSQAINAAFEKYSKNAQNLLSRAEISNFALGEFNFTVPNETLDQIFQTIVEDGASGVKLQEFHLLKCAIGVAREIVRDKQRCVDRESLKLEIEQGLRGTAAAMAKATKSVRKVDVRIQSLVGKVKTMPVPHMINLADSTDKLVNDTKTQLGAAMERLDKVRQSLSPDLKEAVKEALQIEKQRKLLELQLEKAAGLSLRFRESANKKRTTEMDKFRGAVLKIIRYNQRVKSLTTDQLFSEFDTDGDGEINREDFVKFFETAQKNIKHLDDEPDDVEDPLLGASIKEDDLADAKTSAAATAKEEEAEDDEEDAEAALVEPEEEHNAANLGDEFSAAALGRLFEHLAEEGKAMMAKDAFMRMIRTFYKCVKETVVTDGMSIKESKPIRRLEVSEVVEILEGPIKEDSFEVMRVQARMLKDGTEGWISIAGNRGTVFLQRGGNMFCVVQETVLSHSLELEEGKGFTKLLPVGEVLEMHEVPREDAVSGFTRMKAKVKSDGTVGWVTTMENPKKVFVKVL